MRLDIRLLPLASSRNQILKRQRVAQLRARAIANASLGIIAPSCAKHRRQKHRLALATATWWPGGLLRASDSPANETWPVEAPANSCGENQNGSGSTGRCAAPGARLAVSSVSCKCAGNRRPSASSSCGRRRAALRPPARIGAELKHQPGSPVAIKSAPVISCGAH